MLNAVDWFVDWTLQFAWEERAIGIDSGLSRNLSIWYMLVGVLCRHKQSLSKDAIIESGLKKCKNARTNIFSRFAEVGPKHTETLGKTK